MKILIQQGFGKGDKIDIALSRGYVGGVILSPRDEAEEKIRFFRREIDEKFGSIPEVLFDPQFYYATYTDGTAKKLSEYPYYPGVQPLSSFRSSTQLRHYAEQTISYQLQLGVSSVITPTIFISNFGDRKAQVALNLAEESIDYVNELNLKKPLLVSLAFQETALSDIDRVDEFLNELSMLKCDGFYLTVGRASQTYSQDFDSDSTLSNLLYFIYSLSEINEFNVVMGYSDIVGLLYLGVGASAIATGWHNSSRKFSEQQRILPTKGGRSPRERYTSVPLLNSILISELDSIYDNTSSDVVQAILSGSSEDTIIKTGGNPSEGWSRSLSHQQHWGSLNKAVANIYGVEPDVSLRLDNMEAAILEAQALYTILESNAIQFERTSNGIHLNTWLSSIRLFREQAQV